MSHLPAVVSCSDPVCTISAHALGIGKHSLPYLSCHADGHEVGTVSLGLGFLPHGKGENAAMATHPTTTAASIASTQSSMIPEDDAIASGIPETNSRQPHQMYGAGVGLLFMPRKRLQRAAMLLLATIIITCLNAHPCPAERLVPRIR